MVVRCLCLGQRENPIDYWTKLALGREVTQVGEVVAARLHRDQTAPLAGYDWQK